MRRSSLRPAIALAIITTAALALACSDATGPDGPKHPIVGVYDITTSLTSYTYVSGTTLPYTFSTVAAGPARLTGTLTINDSVVAKPGGVELPSFVASMQETPCGGINPPCTSAGISRSADYTFASYLPLQVSSDSVVTGRLGSPYEIIGLQGSFAGDSITGTIEWDAKLGPAGESYSGTFVARRRK